MLLIEDYLDKTIEYKKEYGDKTIVFMQCGSFFEVYALVDGDNYIGSEIVRFSQICDLNIVEKKATLHSKQVVMAGFKEPYWEKYTKKMQDQGFSVVVFTQDEACANTTRSLFGIFSPGSYFTDSPDQVSNYCCCIWIEKFNFSKINNYSLVIGVSLVDILTGYSQIFEYKEQYSNNPNTYDQVEKLISAYDPSESIIISDFDDSEIDTILNYIQLDNKKVHRIDRRSNKKIVSNCEKQTFQKEILTKFFEVSDFTSFYQPFMENPLATQSFCYLLDFLYQHNAYLVNKLSCPEFYNQTERLLLANHSLKQLNIISESGDQSKKSGMVNLLNECCTNMGKRTFKFQFLNPICNVEKLKYEYEIIDELQVSEIDNLRSLLRFIPDLSLLKRKIIMDKITPKNLYKLHIGLCKINNLLDNIAENRSWQKYFAYKRGIKIEETYRLVNILKSLLETKFDLEKCKYVDNCQKFENNFIQSNVDSNLDQSISELNKKEKELQLIQQYLNNLLSNVEKSKKKDVDLVKFHETEKNNVSLILTNKRSKLLETQIDKLKDKEVMIKENNHNISLDLSKIIFANQSSTNKFIQSPEIVKITKDIYALKLQVMENIFFAYKDIVKELEGKTNLLEEMEAAVVIIDMMVCKVYLSSKYKLSKPLISNQVNKSFINCTGLRHLWIEEFSKNEIYVPNNIDLGCNDTKGILLYGTNAVGKTSFIKSIGIALIMAQAGLFVPCQLMVYYPYQSLFTRLLGCDNMFKGLSTFAVEMNELRSILKFSNQNSLVLGDELCSGTESVSAKSIFVAGIKYLYEKDASFIFATHLHEIITYDEVEKMKELKLNHMEVVFNREKNRLEYNRHIKEGPGESIYGLEVCKALDLPLDFLESANEIRMKYNPSTQSILERSKSNYNAGKIKGNKCEICKIKNSSEIHHLIPQKEFTEKISTIKNYTLRKNNIANLCSICETCHDKIHKDGIMYKRIKTTEGYDLVVI